MDIRLDNKVALVTGGSRGIGKSIALALARSGADVAVSDVLVDDGLLDKVVEEITGLGRRAIGVKADVSCKADVTAMVKETVAKLGRIDILVNNAGLNVVGPSMDLEEARWKYGIDVMLTGVFLGCQAAAKEMARQKGGKIINISSIYGISGIPERACYCSVKAAVIQLTRVLGCEWAKYNINVNAVAPGYVKTPQIESLIAQGTIDESGLAGRTPMGRLGKGEEIAEAVVYLASDKADYITGHTLVVDGGWTAFGYLESWLSSNS